MRKEYNDDTDRYHGHDGGSYDPRQRYEEEARSGAQYGFNPSIPRPAASPIDIRFPPGLMPGVRRQNYYDEAVGGSSYPPQHHYYTSPDSQNWNWYYQGTPTQQPYAGTSNRHVDFTPPTNLSSPTASGWGNPSHRRNQSQRRDPSQERDTSYGTYPSHGTYPIPGGERGRTLIREGNQSGGKSKPRGKSQPGGGSHYQKRRSVSEPPRIENIWEEKERFIKLLLFLDIITAKLQSHFREMWEASLPLQEVNWDEFRENPQLPDPFGRSYYSELKLYPEQIEAIKFQPLREWDVSLLSKVMPSLLTKKRFSNSDKVKYKGFADSCVRVREIRNTIMHSGHVAIAETTYKGIWEQLEEEAKILNVDDSSYRKIKFDDIETTPYDFDRLISSGDDAKKAGKYHQAFFHYHKALFLSFQVDLPRSHKTQAFTKCIEAASQLPCGRSFSATYRHFNTF